MPDAFSREQPRPPSALPGRAGPARVLRALLPALAFLLPVGYPTRAPALDELPIVLPEGNLVAVGIGAYPDYIGSDDYAIGAIPLARYQFWGKRDVSLIGNDLRVNVLDTDHWRLGPTGIYRFGRSDVEDDVVRRVHEVDGSLDLGLFVGYEWHDAAEPRKRLGASAWGLADVTDTHGGWTAGANAFGAYPVALPLTLVGGGGVTYGSGSYMDAYFSVTPADTAASGLRTYRADAGVRDVRAWLMALVHLSPNWTIGGGVVYSWLADQAAQSPIVADRGSRHQLVYGLGVMYIW
jgi:outer membrane protein